MPVSDVRLALTDGGVSLLLDSSEGRLPAVVHWGAALDVDDEAFRELVRGLIPVGRTNMPDEPIRVALLPEGHTGWQGRPGLAGCRDDGSDWSPRFDVTAVEVDGRVVSGFVQTGPAVVTYRAQDAEAALSLTLVVELLAGGLVRARAHVTNDGATDYTVHDLLIAWPVPMRGREILDFAGRWTKERVPQRSTLQVGTHWREARHGRSGADSAYLLHLGEPGFGFAHGEIWSVHTAWSGNHVHYAERLQSGDQVIGGGELLLPGEGRLAPGASYAGPWVYANYGEGLDQLARRFHGWLRGRPQHPDAHRPVTINVWEAVYFDHDLPRLLDLAERAADLGVERFVLDDGWFGARRDDHAGLGDWYVSPDAWPDGLSPLIDRVRSLGMQFGLWFEPEMVNPDSDVARAHPDWIMQPGHGRLPVESRFQQVLNLGVPECYDYIRERLLALLDEYPIDYIKWDHNRDLVEAGTAPGGAAGVHAQTEAFYRLLDELKAAHPGLEIESCASGGGRIDLEVMQRASRVWVSDCIDPLERQHMMRWTTQLLPPEMLGSHIASGRSHTTFRTHELDFRAATALWGHLGIEWDLAQASEAELAGLRRWIALHKEHRELLFNGEVVRVDTPDAPVILHGVVTPERGLFALTALELGATASWGRVVLPGLDPDARYRIEVLHDVEPPAPSAPWSSDGGTLTMTGRALASVGVRAPYLPPDQTVIYRATRLEHQAR